MACTKRFSVTPLAFFLIPYLFLAAMPVHAVTLPTPAPPSIAAQSYVLEDFHSGKIIAQKNADKRIAPASLTKMMTAYVVFHELAKGRIGLDDKVTISKKAWHTGGSRTFVKVGSKVSVRHLLQGMIVQSGNDATVALAEYIGGTVPTFAQYMNQFASKLGMDHTHFANATGLPDPQHYSTARDLATLAQALVRDFPQYLKFFGEKEFTWNGIKQYNRNELLWRDPSVDGLKTGHTKAAGYCLVATAKRDDMRLITVVAHTDSNDARASTSEALLNYGYRFFKTRKLYKTGAVIKKLRVWKGKEDTVPVGIQDALFITVPQTNHDKPEIKVNTAKRIMAPIKSGQKMGTLEIMSNGKVVAQKPLYALQSVKLDGWFGRLWDSIVLFFMGLF